MSRILTRPLLELLLKAGSAGMTTHAMAEAFDDPVKYQRRSNIANKIMRQLEKKKVVIAGNTEPTYYNNIKVRRWYANPVIAMTYLAYKATARDKARNRNQAILENRARRDWIIAEAIKRLGTLEQRRAIPPCQRKKYCHELRDQWQLTQEDIGKVFGINRERVRQILVDQRPSICHCPECEPK